MQPLTTFLKESKNSNFRFALVMLFVGLNAISNSIQNQHAGNVQVLGVAFYISPSMYQLVSGFGEAFTGTTAISLFLCILKVSKGVILISLLILGVIWESLQYWSIIPGYADYLGDLTAYFLGTITGFLFDFLLKGIEKPKILKNI